MKTRALLFFLFTLSVFAIGTVITVLFNTVPTNTEVIALLYLSLFVAVFGAVFFTTYLFSYLRAQALPGWEQTLSSLRLGTVLGAMVITLLAIRSINLLNIPTFIIIVLLTFAAEIMLRRKIRIKARS